MSKTDKTVYEIGYHLIPTTSPEDVAKEVGKIKEKITSLGGEIVSEEYPNLINLSYEMIKEIDNKNIKFNSAYFGWIKFDLEPVSIAEINKLAESSLAVLRFIIIKTVRENTIFSKIAKPAKRSVETEEVRVEQNSEMNEAEVDKKIDELVAEEESSL